MKIFVQGKSEIKLKAVVLAFPHSEVSSVDAPFEKVNEQPFGFSETFEGASRRCNAIYRSYQNQANLYVGIENGIFQTHGRTFDFAVVAFKFASGHELFASSAGIMLPAWAVNEAERRGFNKHTVGSVLAEKKGWNSTDPHFELLGQISSRLTLLTYTVDLCYMQSLGNFYPNAFGNLT